MADRRSHKQKFHKKITLDAGTGVKGEPRGYEVFGETNIRVTPVGVGGTNVIDIEARLLTETAWTSIGTVTGTTSDTIDISTYDLVRFNQTTSDGNGEVIVSGFFNQVGSLAGTAAVVSFKTIQADAGTNPVADSPTDTLTLTSSDASITITGNSTTDTIDFAAASGSAEITYVKDVKTAASFGGTFSNGAWRTRDLNTLTGATGSVSIATNQITLTAGTYHIEATAPAANVNGHQTRFENITDTVTEIIGSSEYSGSASNTGTMSRCIGVVTVASTKVYELQHRCQTSAGSFGYGLSANFSISTVYSQIKITKVA